ncbi:hypothetical protein CMI47_12820 [Candidatus Pacearchaeota archaeon]|nr:hypothetical protein [Candidatus Pacearchaeota archaeon]|tara:strand:- start:639 stop:1073 length:435 start_codon:yes stop_codon:yes gene_type:complete
MTSNELRNHVQHILREMLHIEQEKQDDVLPAKEPEVETEPQSDVEASEEETGEALYTVETMIKLFNAIRSGSSMKDDDIVKSLNMWWDKAKLEDLKKFLSALANVAQIVSNQESEEKSQELEEPSAEEEVEKEESNTELNITSV